MPWRLKKRDKVLVPTRRPRMASRAQLAQEQFGFSLIGLTDQVGLGLDDMRALITTHWLGPCASFPHEGSVPPHCAGGTDLEPSGGFPA
ncbi:hypothetical protein ASF08_23240 [Methylobacterium sp. Leaf85]|nr:hypothetical protein ASF08_23240 [Methylobacterium sp. Leaf85]